MNANKLPPAFIRYLKPRLQPFSRPLFWGSLSILSLFGVVIYQYGRYSFWLETNSEITTVSDSLSDKNLPNQINASQFSLEDLAIGADIENLDLLFQEVNQNQNFSLKLSSNFQENLSNQNSKDKNQNRFQPKQQAKPDRSSFSPYFPTFQNNLNNQQNSTLISPINKNINSPSASYNSIPNPVGNLYLTNRQQFFNSHQALSTKNNLENPVNPLNSVEAKSIPAEISPLTTKDSSQNSDNKFKTQINQSSSNPLINQVQSINNLGFELKENNDNSRQTTSPISQPNNYLNPFDHSNLFETNSNSSELPTNNLNNYQIQPLDFYQLHPDNYQLQPQKIE